MILIHDDALEQACREEALKNCGYLDVGDRAVLSGINDIYGSDERVLEKRRYKESVTKSDVQSGLEQLVENDSDVQQIDENRPNVFFFDPFKYRGFNDEKLLQDLASTFEDNPIRTQEQLRANLSVASIPGADFHLLTRTLEKHNYLEKGFTSDNSEYYKAGRKLKDSEHVTNLPSLSKKLKEEAGEDGVVTLGDISEVLNIQVGPKIADELVESGDLYDLGDKYVVATEGCLEDYVRDLVDQPFVTAIENEFEDANYILSRSEFEESIKRELNERDNILSKVDDESHIIEAVDLELRSRHGLSFETKTFPTQESAEEFLLWSSKVDDFVRQQAENALKDEANGELPHDERAFVARVQEAIRDREFSGTRIDPGAARTDHYRDLISEEVEKIAKQGDLQAAIKAE